MHDLRAGLCFDQVLEVDQGHLAAAGKPGDVLTPELIHRVFRVKARMDEGMLLELP